MSIDLDLTASELKRDKLVDRGRLKPGGRQEVRVAMERTFKEARLRSYVLLLPAEEPLDSARPLWDKLGLNDKEDMLLVSNGHAWEGRGWGLTRGEIDRALLEAEPARHQYLGRGVARAVEGLATASLTKRAAKPAPTAGSKTESGASGVVIGVASVGAAAVLGTVGFAIYRRNKRGKEIRAAFDAVVQSAERAYAELVLSSEDLMSDEGAKLQLRAGELKKRFDALVSESRDKDARMEDPVVLGRIRQYESEFAALRSTGLQIAKRQAIECSSPESESISPARKRIEEWDPSSGSDLSSEPSSISGAAKKS